MTEHKEVDVVNASRRNRRTALQGVASVAVMLLPHVASAQAPPATQPPAAVPAAQQAATPAPSAAVAAVIADAQAKIKAGQFAEAVATLTSAETPGLVAADTQALDFALADAQTAWGFNSFQAAQFDEAADHLNAALAVDQRYPQRLAQKASDLRRIGVAWSNMGQYGRAVGYYEQVLSICQQAKDRAGEADALIEMGRAYHILSQYAKAIGYYEQAVSVSRQGKGRNDEARALNCLGNAYNDLSQHEKAISYYEQSLSIYQQSTDRAGEAYALMDIGNAYNDLSQYAKAIGYDQQALSIFRQVKDGQGEGGVLVNLGVVSNSLSQHEKAISYFEQALPILRMIRNRDFEANALIGLGNAYYDLSQYAKAIGYEEQALSIFRQVKDRHGEAGALVNLGSAYASLRQHEKAIGYYEQALPILRMDKGRDFEANALSCLGNAYENLSQYKKAIGYYEQALTIYQLVKDRDGEATVLYNLAAGWSANAYFGRNPGLAILFSKQSINVLQLIRADIHGMDKQTQQRFAKSKENYYRDLAELLISQHRLPEALQVLDLLKQEEYLNFSKPSPGKPDAAALLAKAADLTPREQRCSAMLEKAGGILERDAAKQSDLENVKQPTSAQQSQLSSITTKVASDGTDFKEALDSLSTAFPKEKELDPRLDRLASTGDSRELQTALSNLGDGSVALYTLVSGNKLRLLLVTPTRIGAREVALKDANNLNKKIVTFRAILQDPYSDPRPLGKQLYDLLIGPIRPDLDRAHAKTLLVSLDGNLRYIPLAALSPDGKHYLVESYRTALYTPAAIANLTRAPKPKWTALAMGVSDAPAGFAPLPAVPAELRSVVRQDGEAADAANGVFQGVRLLNATFTKPAMISALGKDYPLVHIASHFVFTGDEASSFLLLGDGTHLTLSDLKALPEGIFAGVNLLTLSACETATGGIAIKGPDNGNGSRDVENVAVLAQRKGADAVLASLWSVSDESTGLLMRTFYRDRQGGTATGRASESKAEALRQAQMALLAGKAAMSAGGQIAKRSQLLSTAPAAKVEGALAFVVDPKKPWAHPYYWAPFILIGNFK